MRWNTSSDSIVRSGSSPEDPTILYGDPWLLVVLKPTGLLSQPGRGDHQQDSLITRLQRLRGEHHLVHRLDRDTSGVVLVARCLDSLRRCSALFAARRVNKLYEAEVEGQLHGRGRIDSRLARLDRDPPRYGDHPQGRPSTTLWRVRARQEDSTKLWLRPLTGRSHQLRAHLAGIGHPILGDPIYGEGSMTPLRLHARALGFQHPFTGRRLRVFTRQDDDNHAG